LNEAYENGEPTMDQLRYSATVFASASSANPAKSPLTQAEPIDAGQVQL
jgi:hypothetical protein